jgi:arsenate reductase (thioredoxin)
MKLTVSAYHYFIGVKMKKTRVLFICVQNSARSQMAEAFLKKFAGERFEAESAGLEPGVLNPLVVKAMGEIGIDISTNPTRSAYDLLRQGRLYGWVITVCDETQAEACPIFPGVSRRQHWNFPDPAAFIGSEKEKLEQVRELRDRIAEKVQGWLEEL